MSGSICYIVKKLKYISGFNPIFIEKQFLLISWSVSIIIDLSKISIFSDLRSNYIVCTKFYAKNNQGVLH